MPHRPPRLGQQPKRERKPDDRRSAHARGYGSTWQHIRRDVLADEPLCRHCLALGITAAATDVDHITPRSKGGTDHRDNLQPLCHSCHSRKTALADR